MTNSFKSNLYSGIVWSIIGQFGYLGLTLIVNIILARILLPSEFGQMGIVLFFIVIAKVLTESGLSGALVRNNNANDVDYSTIFIFNLIVSVILSVLLIIFSKSISSFYTDPDLKYLLMASSSILVINAFQLVQSTKLVKQMRFKRKSIYEIISVFISGTIGIILALNNYGVWALVIMQILNSLILSILYWNFEGNHGSFIFNRNSFIYHYKFGVNTTFASLINSVFDNIYQVILGKYFSIAQTGLYFQAKKLQEIPVGIINKLTQSVIFSGLSNIQDDKIKFKYYYQKITRILTTVVGFICLILFVYSDTIILLILGKQWLDASFFLQILSVVGFFYIQEMFNRILFKIYDDTRYILFLEIIKKSIQTFSIVFGLYFRNLEFLMYGFLIASFISYMINYYFTNKKYVFLGYGELKIVLTVFVLISSISYLNYLLGFKVTMNNLGLNIFFIMSSFLIGIFMFKIFNLKLTYKKIIQNLCLKK